MKLFFSKQFLGFGSVFMLMVGVAYGEKSHSVKTETLTTTVERTSKVAPTPHIPNTPAPSVDAMDEQIGKGVKFLLNSQNPDGSWGSARQTKGLNVLCPMPGGAMAFKCAVTALDVLGLMNCAPEDTQVQLSLDRAEAWLLENLPKLRRTDDMTLLDIWGHAYGIRALCALSHRVSPQSQAYEALRKECENQMKKLFIIADGGGGWGYYEFEHTSHRPSGLATSFCTATALLAIRDAQVVFNIPGDKKIIDKAVKYLYAQRTPTGMYVYSTSHRVVPQRPINTHMGSLARTPACNAALHAFGHKGITDKEIKEGLEWLWARGGWLDMARKKPVPHESFAQNSGYFFYYGYFYASECINDLAPEERPRHSSFLSHVLLPLQEKDGSWWDYPLYDFHKPYGTGYALYSLAQAREALYGEKFKAPEDKGDEDQHEE